MKSSHPTLSFPGRRHRLLLCLCFLGVCCAAYGQVYKAQLSGAAEVPSNPSPASGMATVTISGTFMRVEVQFQGLLGITTASHIHAPTLVPGTGTAGVATVVPTFMGFPLGVSAGTYDHTYDMLLATSYNPTFLNANGGTPAAAFAALKAAMDGGRSYLNVHTTVFPGGEIRGFLSACPVMTVVIPDAFARDRGVAANTVYPAYAPASSLHLTTSVSGGSEPLSYLWSTGAGTDAITVSPTETTVYSVTVTDRNGCTGTAAATVYAVDVAGGNKGKQIVVCHKGNSLAVASPAVASHLDHGDLLGACAGADLSLSLPAVSRGSGAAALAVSAGPNPSRGSFTLRLQGREGSPVRVSVYDVLGRRVEEFPVLPSLQTMQIGGQYRPGIYLVEVVQGAETKRLRLVKDQ